MSLTRHRTIQYVGILLVLVALGAGYWYFAVRAGVKTNTSGSQPQGAGDLSAGLAGYWKFDENTGTSAADASTNGNTGTLTNGPTWTTGQIGGAVNFDGVDDYAVTGSDAGLDNIVILTACAWIYPDTVPSSYAVIFGKWSAGGWAFEIVNNGSTVKPVLWRTFSGSAPEWQSGTALTTGQWSHVCIIHDRSSTANAPVMYVNGVSTAVVEINPPTGTADDDGTSNFQFSTTGGEQFDGRIDEARVYNRSLSSDEVGQLYRLTSPTGTDTGLKGYWSFNGDAVSGTTAYDWSGAGNTGTLTNGPTVTDGRIGQALDFDGTNDSVTVADSSVVEPSNPTLSAWFKASSPQVSTNYGGIVSKAEESGYFIEIDVDGTDCGTAGYLCAGVYISGSYRMVGTPITLGEWHHVAMTYDGSVVTLYLDGVMVDTNSISGSITYNSEPLCIGADASSGTCSQSFFTGSIDEPRVYNRALSAAEIKSLYDRGSPDKANTSAGQKQGTGNLDSGLAGYWKLDENTGTSAADSSTNASTGTLTNGPTWTTGQIGSAVNFDGTNDYITDPGATAVDIRDSLSLATWVKFDSFPSSGNEVTLIRNMASDYIYDLVLYNSSGTYYLEFTPGSGASDNRVPVSVTTGTWYHVAVAFDTTSDAVNFYLDGALVGSKSDSVLGGYAGGTGTLYFGSSNGTSEFLDGQMDEVRIYDRSLSSDEVGQLYRLTSPTGTDTGLKGYWSFNGDAVSGTTAYDWSGAGNTGTLTNGPTVKWGRVGQALNFDGTNDYVNVGSAAALDDMNLVTICAWAKPDTIGNDPRIYAKADANGLNGIGTNLTQTTNRFEFRHGWTGEEAARWNTSDNSVVIGAWHHLCATYDGSSTANDPILYIDGVSVPVTEVSAPSGTLSSDASYDAIIGNRPDAARPYDGMIDEVRVYSRILSAAEIKAQYDAAAPDKVNTSVSTPQGTGNLDSGLAGYWKLDENTGTSAGDTSTNGNAGTLTNGPTWTTGQIGSAVNFDGTNDYVVSASARIPRKGSVSAWVNTTEAMDLCTLSNVFSMVVPGSHIQLQFNSCSVEYDKWMLLYRGNYGTYAEVSGPTYTSTSQYQGWHHLTATWDDARGASLYIDGALAGSTTTTTDAIDDATATSVYLGSESGTLDYYSGKIDEVRLYNRALSADEVGQLYRLATPTGTDTGLKGYWSFNGQDMSGTTAYDRSGARNDGTLTNGPAVKWGKLGQALQFDGTNDYVTMGDIAALDGVTAMTASAWAKTPVGMSTEQHIVDKAVCSGATNSGTFELWHSTGDGGKPSFTFYKNGGSPADYRATSSVEIDDDQWHLVTGTYDGTAVRIYVDGVETGSTTATSITAPSTTYAVEVGGRCNGTSFPWTGSIDEVRLYNRALSANEIKALYNSGK